jgi:hypothetical protein
VPQSREPRPAVPDLPTRWIRTSAGCKTVLATSVIFLGLLICREANGQVVHGQVLDAIGRTPVALARITVLQGEVELASPLTTTREGEFEMALPGPGFYRIRIQRLGYPDHTSLEFSVGFGERVEILMELSPQAIPLAPWRCWPEDPSGAGTGSLGGESWARGSTWIRFMWPWPNPG